MESYILDVILITLAVIVLLHLFYNTESKTTQCTENMSVVNSLVSSLTETEADEALRKDNKQILPEVPTKTYDDGIYRDKGTIGLDRTSCSKPWYHYTNRLVKGIDDEKILKDGKSRKDINREAVESLIKSGKVNKGRLVFEDNYTDKVTSDPFEADITKYPPTLGGLKYYSDEKYIDVLGNVCSLDDDKLDMNRYIRDFVLDGNAQCGCVVDKSKLDFTRDEVDEYREKFIEFKDKINGTSALPEDPVDKMNKITLQGGVKADGQTIADFYDKLVGSTGTRQGPGFVLGSPIPSDRCVRPPVFDASSGVPQGYYTKNANNGGRYMLRDNWVYNNENPNNGGIFYDGISGQDPMIDNDRMV
jgi:hypothetical protein